MAMAAAMAMAMAIAMALDLDLAMVGTVEMEMALAMAMAVAVEMEMALAMAMAGEMAVAVAVAMKMEMKMKMDFAKTNRGNPMFTQGKIVSVDISNRKNILVDNDKPSKYLAKFEHMVNDKFAVLTRKIDGENYEVHAHINEISECLIDFYGEQQ